MRNPYDVLRSKEQELVRVKKEVEALRITARLLGVEEPAPAISLAKGDARQARGKVKNKVQQTKEHIANAVEQYTR